MNALDRAKRLQAALGKLAERRDRQIEKANGEFRLDLLAVIDTVDDETVGLVMRGLAIDREQHYLQLSLQLALDERNDSRRSPSPSPLPTTRRSRSSPGHQGDDLHEAETDAPPPLPSSFDLGDEDDLSGLDTPLPPPPGMVQIEQSGVVVLEGGQTLALGELRYPEPGEPAVTLPDGTVVAAPQP
jgi:hypothetical protein